MKLYCVKITHSAYVLARNEERASDHEYEIQDWEESNTEIYETRTNELGWNKDCLVYHSGENDITLSEALQLVNGANENHE